MSALEDPALLAAAVSAVTAAITVGGGAIVARVRARSAEHRASARVAVAREQGAADALPLVLGRLTAVESTCGDLRASVERAQEAARDYAAKARQALDAVREAEDACTDRLLRVAAEHAAQRRADDERCQRALAEVRAEVGRVAARTAEVVRESRGGREDTGLHELEAIARRSTTPLPQRLDLPEPRRAVHPPPLGGTPRTTIRPPDEGGGGEP